MQKNCRGCRKMTETTEKRYGLIKKTLENYIRNKARLELEYICEPRGCIKEELWRFIRQFDKNIEKVEKDIGLPKDIIYSVFINKQEILRDEYKAMLKDFKLDTYSPQTFEYSIHKRDMLRKNLDYMEGKQ